jgi:hypothetical protein
MISILKTKLSQWTEFDVAMYWLACSLGLLEQDETMEVYNEYKALFWTNNKHHQHLKTILDELVGLGALEYKENDNSLVRWNAQFVLYPKEDQPKTT